MSWILDTAFSTETGGWPHPDDYDTLTSVEKRPGACRTWEVGMKLGISLGAKSTRIVALTGEETLSRTTLYLAPKAVHPLSSDNQIS